MEEDVMDLKNTILKKNRLKILKEYGKRVMEVSQH